MSTRYTRELSKPTWIHSVSVSIYRIFDAVNMEAVPRLPMLSCELKISTSNVEFGPALKKYVAEFYHENPENYSKEIKEIEALRLSAVRVPRDFTGCRILKRYFSQLQCLQNRFPMSENGAASVAFMWNDLYSGFEYGIMDIHFEQACILYNIGALHSELGAADCRTNAEGMKVACTHFQCAAWAFQHLRDTPSYPTPRGSDTSRDLLTCFITQMLAQAQECILEKSMLDSRKSTITAKVAAQVVDYYHSALNILQEGSANVEAGCILDTVGSKVFKHWKKFMEFKIAYYSSISHLYMGNQAEEQQQMGERVAWYTAALNKHSEAVKIAKGLDREDLNEALTFTLDIIVGKCNAAKKENDFVYHEKVTSLESLPEVKGGSLVKGIPFDPTDPDICGPDIFAKLVPMEAHEASSVYSEEKAKILRNISARIDENEQELLAYMASLQLDRDMLEIKEETLPQEVIEKCAALSVNPHAINDIKDSLKALSDVFNEVEVSVKDVRKFLQLEEEREKEHQEVFGKRPPSLIITELTKECSKYEEAHRRASESNATLQKALELHLANLELLASPLDHLQKALPNLNIPESPEKTAVVQELLMLLDKVEEMRRQRHQLDVQLRDAIQADDITKLLVARDRNQDLQKLFSEQLKKHEQILGYLEQNLSAQDNILRALTNANARFAVTRKAILEMKQRREMTVASLLNSYDAYEDLISKAQKGMDFYRKLHTNVVRLQARTKSVTSVQEEERQQIAQAQARKVNKTSNYSSAVSSTANFQSPSVSSGHKLKDFLPYMTSSRGKTPSSVPDVGYVPAPADITAWNTSSDRASSIQRSTNTDIGSGFAQEKKPSDINSSYSQSTPDPMPMGVRPAPVGSEQVPPISSCTPYVTPIVSSGSYSHADVKAQNWGTQNIAYPLQEQQQQPYVSTGYAYPTSTYQYHPSSQYTPTSPSVQSYNYSNSNAYAQSASIPPSTYIQDATQAVVSSSSMISSTHYAPQAMPSSAGAPSLPMPSGTDLSYSNTCAPYSASLQNSGAGSLPAAQYSNQSTSHPQPYYSNPSVTTPSYVTSQVTDPQFFGQHSNYPSYVDPSYVQNLPSTPVSQHAPVYAQSSAIMTGTVASNSYYCYGPNMSSTQQPYSEYNSSVPSALSTPQHPEYAHYSASSGPVANPSQESGNSQYIYPAPASVPSSAMNYATPVTGFSYSSVGEYTNPCPNGNPPNFPPDNQYGYVPDSTIPSDTSPRLTYSSGNQSQYTPGHQSSQQTYTVNTYGDCGIMSSYNMTQSAPQATLQSTNFYPTSSADTMSQYSYVVPPKTENVSSIPAPSAFSDKVLVPSPRSPSVTSPTPNKSAPAPENQQQSSPQSPANSVCSSQGKNSSNELKNKDILDSLVADLPQDGLRPVLQPKVLSLTELCAVKTTEAGSSKSNGGSQRQIKDPFLDRAVLDKFVTEVERYKKVVESLTKKSLMGQTPLDQKFKEVVESQDKDSKKTSISVARCYPMKNRFPEVMPYDSNRVELHSARNDYINASYVSDLVPTCPKFIVTQAPMPSTYAEFWTMVWEQQAEILVCLLANAELKGHIYWPIERNQSFTFGPVTVNLHSIKETSSHVESMLNVTHNETKISRVVIHLQYIAWPPGEVPSNPSTFLQFIGDVHSYHGQQRNLQRPIIIHCTGGVGRSGAFCLLSSAIKELSQGRIPPDMSTLAALACQQRRFLLQEREQLKFCYEATLYHAQDILVKRGILSNKSTFDDVLPSAGNRRTHSRHPSEDFILSGSISTKQQASNENEDQASSTLTNSEVETEEQTVAEDKVVEPVTSFSELAANAPVQETNPIPRQPSITSILDPANFTLDPVASPSKQRFTKDSFKNPTGLVQVTRNSNDPLNQLDPLWSLKKESK